MATTPSKPTFATRNLTEIVGALTQEIGRAEIATELSRAAMREIYDRHPVLKGTEPSRVRVAAVKVSIPLGIDGSDPGGAFDPGLSVADLRRVLPADLGDDEAERSAESIVKSLEAAGRNRLADARLPGHVGRLYRAYAKARAVEQKGGSIPPNLDPKRLGMLRDIQRIWRRQAAAQSETRFVYRAEDLRALGAEQLIRVELSLDVG